MMKSHRSSRANTREDEKERVILPKINDSKLSTESGQAFDNPFFVPSDEEIFKWKNREKEEKMMEKIRERESKIWEKGLRSSQGRMRELLALEEIDEEDEGDGKINIVEAAQTAIKNRVRHKEPVNNFVNKKREMLLFQMGINQKKEQIKEFEELAHLQEIGLQNAMGMLEKDAETFKKFVEENKNQTRIAIKIAEDETKKKQEKIQEMKLLQETLSTITSKNTKQLERLEKLYAYKVFLDDLTGEEYLKQQEKFKEQRSNISRSRSQNVDEEPEKKKFNWLSYNSNLSPGMIEFLDEDDDEFEMYFQNPQQLQNLFETLEGNDLFIIKNTKETEQQVEEVRHEYAKKRHEFLEKKRQLQQNKHELEKAIYHKTKATNYLVQVKSDDFSMRNLLKLETAIKLIYEIKKIFGESSSQHTMSGFDMLKEIEKKVEWQLKEMKLYKAVDVQARYKLCLARRKEEANDRKRVQEQLEQQEKIKSLQKRLESQKRIGRPIMTKSKLDKDNKKQVVEDEIGEEEIERRQFFTIRFH
jgi:hypothetical protein